MSAALRILFFAVHDPCYPRNRRLRSYLGRRGHSVAWVAKPSARGAARWLAAVRQLVRGSAGQDSVIVSEFALAFVPLVWVTTRIRRQLLVVDGFVSLYETHVEDWGRFSPRSGRALLYRLVDGLALALADVYLVDTELRAADLRQKVRRRPGRVMSLPVGAPDWAHALPAPSSSEKLRVLYYGNYIPLHGLDLVVDAIDAASARVPISATFLGDGEGRPEVERRVRALGMGHVCTFEQPVPEEELAAVIARHDIVLGVFGRSRKAQGVIANKVWQGLACARPVITRKSEALDEIRAIVGRQLVSVGVDGPGELADALVAAASADGRVEAVAPALEEYVDERFALFETRLRDRARGSR
jgi:glycosyltransferase involved in cell wall biosynthesis